MNGIHPDLPILGKLHELHEGLCGLRQELAERARQNQLPERKAENKTFDQAGFIFDSQGYGYVGVFVSAAQTVHVDFWGVTYDLSLVKGFNSLVLPNDARLYTDAGVNFSGILMRSATTFQ